MQVSPRKKILSDLVPTGDMSKDKYIIPKIIEITLPDHEFNVSNMCPLRSYYYNDTDIKGKTKKQQPEINNKISINYPSIAVTTINSYCFSKPLTFSADGNDIDKVTALNNALRADRYAQKSQHMYLNSGITALGYRYILPPTQEQIKQGIYFETNCDLPPETTYCVYANTLKQEKICAITYQDKKLYDETTLRQKGTTKVFTVFTRWHRWEFYKSAGKWEHTTQKLIATDGSEIEYDAYPLPYKRIPIVENLRKSDRTGDFEQALPLIDANNNLASSRLDDIQQMVDYLIFTRDIDVFSDEALNSVDKALKKGIFGVRSIEGSTVQPEAKIFNVPINQSETQSYQNYLGDKIEEVLNIPNRQAKSSGGDTGTAVESRNGFRSLENIAGLVTAGVLDTENESLDVILAICENIDSCPFKGLKVGDVQIKDNRNRMENMATATSACATLIGAGFNDYDAIRITNLDPDPQAVAKRNQKAREEAAALADTNSQTNIDTTSGDTAV